MEANLIKNKKYIKIKTFIAPIGFFLKNYFIRLGFLDGIEGLYFAHCHLITFLLNWQNYGKSKDKSFVLFIPMGFPKNRRRRNPTAKNKTIPAEIWKFAGKII